MDPDICLRGLLEAVRDRDSLDIVIRASDLADWLNAGGFMPASIDDVLRACQAAIDRRPR